MELTSGVVDGGIVLALRGDLTAEDMPELRRQLGRALTEARDCVVCEVSRLQSADPAAMTLFSSGAVHEGDPGPVICIAGAHGDVAEVIEGLELPRIVPVARSVSDAMAKARQDPPRLFASKTFPPDAAAPRLARRFALETCEEWSLAALCDSVEQVVGELVTNAVHHAGTDLVVRLERTTDRLVVSVTDEQPAAAWSWWNEPADAELATGAGYGLAIVRSLTSAVGVQSHPAWGKRVWAAFSLRPIVPRQPSPHPVRTRITVNAGRSAATSDGARWSVTVELRWHPRRPDRVHLRLNSRPSHPSLSGAHWDLPRAALRDGLSRRVKYDSLRLWPDRQGRQLVVELPGRPARVLRLSAWRVRRFLAESDAPGQHGAEPTG